MEKEEFLEERRHLIAEMLRSNAWREVARQAIAQKCLAIQKKLAENRRLDLEQVREMQAQYAVLKLMFDDDTVTKFFLGD